MICYFASPAGHFFTQSIDAIDITSRFNSINAIDVTKVKSQMSNVTCQMSNVNKVNLLSPVIFYRAQL